MTIPPEVAMGRGREPASARGVPSRIVIPDLTGLIMAAALRRAAEVGFTLAVSDPPKRIAELASSGRWVVANQDPPGGSTRYRDDTVVIVLRHDGWGGEAGDREPRNPLPRRRSGRGLSPADLGEPAEDVRDLANVQRLQSVDSRYPVEERTWPTEPVRPQS